MANFNKKKYFIIVDGKEPEIDYNGHRVKVVVLKQINDVEIRKLEEEEIDKGSIIYKKPINYVDRGYIEE